MKGLLGKGKMATFDRYAGYSGKSLCRLQRRKWSRIVVFLEQNDGRLKSKIGGYPELNPPTPYIHVLVFFVFCLPANCLCQPRLLQSCAHRHLGEYRVYPLTASVNRAFFSHVPTDI